MEAASITAFAPGTNPAHFKSTSAGNTGATTLIHGAALDVTNAMPTAFALALRSARGYGAVTLASAKPSDGCSVAQAFSLTT
jgi:hypothetical protein